VSPDRDVQAPGAAIPTTPLQPAPVPAATGPRALRCGYCGGSLQVNLETTGRAYLSYEQVESIECDETDCSATWEPDGAPRDLPPWLRAPGPVRGA
jgi:hypothetical protein